MKIALGCDHGGYEAKEVVKEFLKSKNYEVVDVGCDSKDSCNYAEFGIKAAELVSKKECDYGIVICTTGEGICIAANKVDGIVCGIGYNDEVSKRLRTHNNANMISFSAEFFNIEEIKRRIDIFLNTNFEGGRHIIRVDTILNYKK